MNRLKTSGWKYWNYFHAINPGASVKGRHAFSALCAVPDDDLGMPSDDDGVATTAGVTTTTSVTTATSATTATSLSHPNHSPMNADDTATDSGNKWCLSITSLSSESRVEPVPASLTVVSNSFALCPKKVEESVIGSTAYSSPSQTSKLPSLISKLASQSASTLSTQKAANIPRQLHSPNWSIWWWAFWTLFVSCLRTVAKSCHEMTAFIHKDDYLLPVQKMHCIRWFINNVAYADCLQGFVGELTDPNDPNAMDTQLNGICSYYSTLLDTHI